MGLATRVPGVEIQTASQIFYYWLSDSALLMCRCDAAGQWTLTRRDVATGKETALPTLTALLTQTGGYAETFRVSPDGHWVLWAGKGKTIQAATLDGSRTASWALQTRRSLGVLLAG